MKTQDHERLPSQIVVWAIRVATLALLAASILTWKTFDRGVFLGEVLTVFLAALYPVYFFVKREKFVWGLAVLLLVGVASLVGTLSLNGRQVGLVNFMFILYSVLASTMFLPEIARRSRTLSPLSTGTVDPTRTPALD